DEISFIAWISKLLKVISVALTTILLVLVSLGMMNVLWIAIRERTREIGTLRAIGMQRTRVLAMFLIEGFLLGLSGTLIGAAVGVLLSLGITGAHIHMPIALQLFLMSDSLVMTPTVGWVG